MALTVIIDYHMGNLRSVAKAFELLGHSVVISDKPTQMHQATHLVLPGVGAFADGMANLSKLGLDKALKHQVMVKKKPLLGICLGMQLLASTSYEFGEHKGLDLVKATVNPFIFKDYKLKVPHVGWNNIHITKADCRLLKDVKQNSEFYFVHSFHLVPDNHQLVVATCHYGIDFAAAIESDNIFATQFHPEKSQTKGLKLIANFLAL